MFSHVTYINSENYIRKWPMGKDLGLPFESLLIKSQVFFEENFKNPI